MNGITWGLAALQLLSAIGVMILILLQKDKGSDGITGNVTASSSGMGMSRENMLSKLTGILGTFFVVLTIIVSTMMVVGLTK